MTIHYQGSTQVCEGHAWSQCGSLIPLDEQTEDRSKVTCDECLKAQEANHD